MYPYVIIPLLYCNKNRSVYVQQNSNMTCFTSSDSWTILSSIEAAIKQKIEAAGIRLKDWNVRINRGILTGCNEAFIISGDKRNELISQNPKSAEIIRPILRGRDIKRYGYTFSDLWVITSHNGIRGRNIPRIHIDEYPAIKAHLDEFYSKLCKRADKGDTPYNLRNCAYMDDFSKQKIVWGNLCLNAQFAYVEDDYFINAPSPMIVPGSKYLLAVLNSKVADWYIRQLGVTRNGGYFEYKPMFVEKLPIPPETRESHNLFV
jgi:type IIS restriction enzyme R and M protein